MTDLEARRYRNKIILSHAHELRKFINGCEDISFLADQVDCIKKFISDFANGVYDMELSEIPNIAALYKFFIINYIMSFLTDYCEYHSLDYENLDTALLVEGEVINPCDGLLESYNKLVRINRKTKYSNILHGMGRLLHKL